MAFAREQIKKNAAALAAQGALIGTSNRKCDGWVCQPCTPTHHEYRGKVATSRFKRDCLNEHTEVFKTVCVDASYYTFPCPEYLQKQAVQVPDDFRFGFKMADTVTPPSAV